MLSSGAAAVPPSACLRCQLRYVLQHLRPSPIAHQRHNVSRRPFSTLRSWQAARDSSDFPPPRGSKDVYYKHISPGGRIVGKPGRKQRQTSEALAINSLGEKSEIVVFRDVMESHSPSVSKAKELEQGDKGLKGLSLSAEEIQAAMSEEGQAPDEEDVNASIDALRPQAPVLEESEFDHLVKELLDGYNMPQLSRYLRRSITSPQSSLTVVRQLDYQYPESAQKRTITFTRSRWQPGRTPLSKRRISEMPSPRRGYLSPKARAAERIVRVAWKVTVSSEEQQLGELEIPMPYWQLALLFDLTHNGKPKYETLIQPPLLLRHSEIQPYRPDRVVRITARRQDAEEIASQLENKVLLMGKLLLDLNALIPENERTASTTKSLQNFRKQDLDTISQRTQSALLQQADGKIGIYSFHVTDRQNARRLLMSLMDLSGRNVKTSTIQPEYRADKRQEELGSESLALIPVFPDRGLHFRHRAKLFGRAAVPVQRPLPVGSEEAMLAVAQKPVFTIEALVGRISRALASIERQHGRQHSSVGLSSASQKLANSHWSISPESGLVPWRVHLGLLLEETKPGATLALHEQRGTSDLESSDTNGITTPKHVLLKQVPHYDTLLSYFKPTVKGGTPPSNASPEPNGLDTSNNVIRKSSIVAHFVPSPFTRRGAEALKHFPRLEVSLRRKWGNQSGAGVLHLESVEGVFNEENVNIPLPEYSLDLRLSKKSKIYVDRKHIGTDPDIRDFVSEVNQSVQSGGSLRGKTEVVFKLPKFMDHSANTGGRKQRDSPNDIPLPYLFERFEQVQRTDFTKNAEALSARAPHNKALARFDQLFPESGRILYKEIEAGVVGGRQTDLSFTLDSMTKAAIEQGIEEGDENPVLTSVLMPALAVSDIVTRATKGEIMPWRPKIERQTVEEGLSKVHEVLEAAEGEAPGNDGGEASSGLDEEYAKAGGAEIDFEGAFIEAEEAQASADEAKADAIEKERLSDDRQ